MRLFLDQGVPRRTAAILREAGVDTVHAGEVGLSMALLEIIETRRDDLDAGALLSVRRSRLRIRRLPVGRGAR